MIKGAAEIAADEGDAPRVIFTEMRGVDLIQHFALRLTRLAFFLSIALPFWMLFCAFGSKFGVLDRRFAFEMLTLGLVPYLATALLASSLIALVLSFVSEAKRGWGAAMIGVTISVAIMAGFQSLRQGSDDAPPIYDVTTDTADAPMFSEALLARRAEEGSNRLMAYNVPLNELAEWRGNKELKGETGARLIARAYPELKPLIIKDDIEGVTELIIQAMQVRGYRDIEADKNIGRVEGTDESFWFGFKEDVTVRIRPETDGFSAEEGGDDEDAQVRVDFRSTSRLGIVDFGSNGERLIDLRHSVEQRSLSLDSWEQIERVAADTIDQIKDWAEGL